MVDIADGILTYPQYDTHLPPMTICFSVANRCVLVLRNHLSGYCSRRRTWSALDETLMVFLSTINAYLPFNC